MAEIPHELSERIYVYSSGLQKAIRRGQIEDALFYAHRMITEFPKMSNAVLKKLLTCLVEDIGFANTGLAFDLVDFLKKENKKPWEIRNTAVLRLVAKFAASPKSREVDNCLCALSLLWFREDEAFLLEYNRDIMWLDSESFKKEVRSGNQELTRSFGIPVGYVNRDYLDELYDEYEEGVASRLDSFWANMPPEYAYAYIRLAKETRSSIGWEGLTLLYYGFFYLFSKYEQELLPFFPIPPVSTPSIDITEYDYKKTRDVPDYVLDKHTSEGRRMGRGFVHFFSIGALLENEIPVLNQKYKNLYFSQEGQDRLKIIDKK